MHSLRLLNVGFKVKKVALKQIFLSVIRSFAVGIIPPTLQTHLFITDAV
jgi:hypothetical protein